VNAVDNQLEELRLHFQKATRRYRLPGVLGKADGTIIDPLRPLSHVFVRVHTSLGLSAPRSVFLPGGTNVPLQAGLPVTLGYDYKNREVVLEIDGDAVAATGVSTASTTQAGATARSRQTDIETLAVVADANQPSLTVIIKAWNPIIDNVAYQFPGARVTLTPPGAGNMRYSAIFIKSDYATVEVINSTARSVADLPLGLADIQECLNAKSVGSTPVYAIKLVGGQTTITQSDIDNDGVPLQQLVNAVEEGHEQKLATVTGVGMNTATATSLYTVPAGRTCVVTRVVVRAASVSLTTASYSFGFTGPAYNDVIADAAHTELTGSTLYVILTPKAGAKVGAAGETFKVLMNTLQGAAATTTMDVFGYLF
jgi:hypothetical protein